MVFCQAVVGRACPGLGDFVCHQFIMGLRLLGCRWVPIYVLVLLQSTENQGLSSSGNLLLKLVVGQRVQ